MQGTPSAPAAPPLAGAAAAQTRGELVIWRAQKQKKRAQQQPSVAFIAAGQCRGDESTVRERLASWIRYVVIPHRAASKSSTIFLVLEGR
eukprot:1228979-Prymnesium_polylepis.1